MIPLPEKHDFHVGIEQRTHVCDDDRLLVCKGSCFRRIGQCFWFSICRSSFACPTSIVDRSSCHGPESGMGLLFALWWAMSEPRFQQIPWNIQTTHSNMTMHSPSQKHFGPYEISESRSEGGDAAALVEYPDYPVFWPHGWPCPIAHRLSEYFGRLLFHLLLFPLFLSTNLDRDVL